MRIQCELMKMFENIQPPKNIIVWQRGFFKEPKNSCAQCTFFRRAKYIDHGLDENSISFQDFCTYPDDLAPSDSALGKLNCLMRCDNFKKYVAPDDDKKLTEE